MATKPAKPLRQIRLSFRAPDELAHADEPVSGDLSALVVRGNALWVANDEFATVERLRMRDGPRYGEHQPFGWATISTCRAGRTTRWTSKGWRSKAATCGCSARTA